MDAEKLKTELENLLQNQNAKKFSQILKSNRELYNQVVEYTKQYNPKNISEMIYIALNGPPPLSPCGKKTTFKKFGSGYPRFCANSCECASKSRSQKVSEDKKSYTDEQKKKINNKRNSTMIEKYGVAHNSQREDIKHIWSKPKIAEETYQKLTNYEWLNEEYNSKQRTLVDIADELNVYYGTVAEYCKKFNFKIRQVSNYSKQETEIAEYIKSLGITVIRNDWVILENQEIDILIPDYNLGIEVDGLLLSKTELRLL